jgi:hypothetical protein
LLERFNSDWNAGAQQSLGARQFLDDLVGDVNRLAVAPEDFQADTGTAIQKALAIGLAEGVPVRLDGAYSLSAPLDVVNMTSGSMTVLGAGIITVTADFSSPVFSFASSFHTPTSVSSITQTTRTFPGGGAASVATKITSASHGASVGELIKVVSDDSLALADNASKRMGEFAYVADVSGNDIYVSGYLLNAYSTTIRVARMRTEPKFLWDGPTFTATADQSGWDTMFLRVRGFLHPRVRTGADNGYDAICEFSSCFQGEADITMRKLRNRVTTEGTSGYGFQDTCSHQSIVRIRGIDTRHAYTTLTNTSTTSDSVYLYGQPFGAIVSGVVEGASSAAFDSHSEGVDITFTNCSTAHSRQGESGAGSALQLRGTRTRAINFVDRYSNNGVSFFAAMAGDCNDCELVNFNYIGAGQPVRMNEAAGSDNLTRPKVKGGYIRTSGVASIKAWDVDGGIIDDLYLAPNSSTNGTTGITLNGDVELLVRRLTIDLSGYTGTQFRAFAFEAASTGNTLIVDGCRVIGASGKFQHWFKANSTSGSTAILSNLKTDAEPTSAYDGVASLDLFQASDGWTLINSWTHSGDVAEVDFTDIAHDEVRVIARGITKGTTGTLNVRVSSNNGSSFKTASGDYVAIAADGQETALTGVPIHTTNATAARSGAGTLSGLRNNQHKMFRADNAATFNVVTTTSIINAIRVYPSGGGDITAGSIIVLGR